MSTKLMFTNVPVLDSGSSTKLGNTLTDGDGVFRCHPAWGHREFCTPGGRGRLKRADLYPFPNSPKRGIDERFLGCPIETDNDPRPPFQGMCMFLTPDGFAVPMPEAVRELKEQLIGGVWTKHGCWPIYVKYFDNRNRLPHHHHLGLKPGGPASKPESYFFPPEFWTHEGAEMETGLGFVPGTTEDDIRRCLESYGVGDNRIMDHVALYRMRCGWGFNTREYIAHSPGSLLTFEAQVGLPVGVDDGSLVATDLFRMLADRTTDGPLGKELLYRHVPDGTTVDDLLGHVRLKENSDPGYFKRNLLPPIRVHDDEGVTVDFVIYPSPDAPAQWYTTRRIVVPKGRKLQLNDKAASLVWFTNGTGRIGKHRVECPAMVGIRDLLHDEFFVSAQASPEIENTGECDLTALVTCGPEALSSVPTKND